MVFNATFNNISVILWWSVLFVEETTDLPQVTDKFRVHIAMSGIRAHNCEMKNSNHCSALLLYCFTGKARDKIVTVQLSYS